jgi:gas vesicle protein
MHYDDSARRSNLLSGLVVGAVLGAGLALILASTSDRSVARRARALVRGTGSLGRAARDALEEMERPAERTGAREPSSPRRRFTL